MLRAKIFLLTAALVALLGAAGAAQGVETSLESAVAETQWIVLGRLISIEDGQTQSGSLRDQVIEVTEVIKGNVPQRMRVAYRAEAGGLKGDVIAFLAAPGDAAGGRRIADRIHSMERPISPRILRMTGEEVTDPHQLLLALREIADFEKRWLAGEPGTRISDLPIIPHWPAATVMSWTIPDDAELNWWTVNSPVIDGRLRVPADIRLQTLGRQWAVHPDWRWRMMGIQALSRFRADENLPLIRALAADSYYEIDESRDWHSAVESRARRLYRVRAYAAQILAAWGASEPVEIEGPHNFYEPLPWRMWALVAASAAAMILLARRRGTALGLGGWLAAALGFALIITLGLDDRSYHYSDTFSLASRSADWEITSARGCISILRVSGRDEQMPGHGPVRRVIDLGWNQEEWYWYMLMPEDEVSWGGFRTGAGRIQSEENYAYRLVRIPNWALVQALALWPAVWVALRIGAHARALVRARRGQCKSCGYDLRSGGPRCPECGAVGRIMVRCRIAQPRMVQWTALSLIVVLSLLSPSVAQAEQSAEREKREISLEAWVARARWIGRGSFRDAQAGEQLAGMRADETVKILEVAETLKGDVVPHLWVYERHTRVSPITHLARFGDLADPPPLGKHALIILTEASSIDGKLIGERSRSLIVPLDEPLARRIIRMNGEAISDPQVFLAAVREAVDFDRRWAPGEPAMAGLEWVSPRAHSLIASAKDITPVERGYLEVPFDSRLEALARQWAVHPDWEWRCLAARGLLGFRAADTEQIIRRLTSDSYYIVTPEEEWQPPARRGWRGYPVRRAASDILIDWSRGPIERIETGEWHDYYEPVPWLRWSAGAASAILLVTLARRRGTGYGAGGWAAIVLGCLTLVSLATHWRSYRVSDSFAFTCGGEDWELTSASGHLSLLRVTPQEHFEYNVVRRVIAGDMDGQSPREWYGPLLAPTEEHRGPGFYISEGTMGRLRSPPYRLVRVSFWPLTGVLIVWPVVCGIRRSAAWVQRYCRLRAGRCVSCGYDLRGRTGRRCPECGSAAVLRWERAAC